MSPLQTVFVFLSIVLDVYNYIFLAYIILSFFPIGENNILVRSLRAICEPVYRFFLRILPPLRISMLDLSPIYVFGAIWILQWVLRYLIRVLK